MAGNTVFTVQGRVWAGLVVIAGLVSSVAWAAAPVAAAAPAAAAPAAEEPTNEALMDEIVHLVRVGRPDDAVPLFQKVLDRKPDPEEALRLRDRAGSDVLARFMNHPQLGAQVTALLRAASQALRNHLTSPEYINRMIADLGKATQAEAIEFLHNSGPYAIPSIIDTLKDPKQADRRVRLAGVLAQMPSEAAPAMIEGLRCPDSTVKTPLADALGHMGGRLALYELRRILDDPATAPSPRAAADLAIRSILGTQTWSAKSALDYYLETTVAYCKGLDWAVPAGVSETLPVFAWDQTQGRLTYVDVPRTRYAPTMAERTALRLIGYWPKTEAAYPILYLADLTRLWEAQARPAENWDPQAITRDLHLLAGVLGDERLAVGLKTALDEKDYRAARGFLDGLAFTAQARTVLVNPAIGRSLTALDRRVRYEAAIAIATAGPRTAFSTADLVVPTLAEAIAQTVTREIVLISNDPLIGNRFRPALREAGFAIDDVHSTAEGLETIRTSAAVELVMIQPSEGETQLDAFVRQVRSDPRLQDLPIIFLTSGEQEELRLKNTLITRYVRTGLLSGGAAADTTLDAVTKAIDAARGPILPPETARLIALRAAAALQAVTAQGGPGGLFNVTGTIPQLEAVLKGTVEPLRLDVCRALGQIGTARAQRDLADAALDKDTSLPVVRAALTALIGAIRRQGDSLTDKQHAALRGLVERNDPEVTQSAATLIGLAGVQPQDIVTTYRLLGGM